MRTVGSLGMSVGTSLAFEENGATLLSGYDSLLFNLRTLVRNAQQSYESSSKNFLNPEQIAKDVEEDIGLIAKWINKNRGAKPVQMSIYLPSYLNLKASYPLADLWEPKTERQKNIKTTTDKVASIVQSKFNKLITKTDKGMPEFKGDGIVLTHHVIDLVDNPSILRLALLESHTGMIKAYTKWYTKLTGGDSLHYMPFNKLTIQVFGDKSVNFRSSSHGVKELVKKLATDGKWTSATSLSKVRATINAMPQGIDRHGLLKML